MGFYVSHSTANYKGLTARGTTCLKVQDERRRSERACRVSQPRRDEGGQHPRFLRVPANKGMYSRQGSESFGSGRGKLALKVYNVRNLSYVCFPLFRPERLQLRIRKCLFRFGGCMHTRSRVSWAAALSLLGPLLALRLND